MEIKEKILTILNKSEEKFLRKKTSDFDFKEFAKRELDELIKKMRRIMKEAHGVGLSANQIGLNFQIFVAEIPQRNKAPKFYAIFNPKIIKASKETEILEEGCLSVPGYYGDVERNEKITLKGLDKNQKEIKVEAYGLMARIFQHEVDHLNGILYIDKAKNVKKYESNSEQKNSPGI